jgi:HEAT repeat protein
LTGDGELRTRSESELIAMLQRPGPTVAEQRSIIRQLEDRGSDHSVEVLRACAQTEPDKVATAALTALARIGTNRATDVLIENLSSQAGRRLFWAADLLGAVRARRAIPSLVRCLETRELHEGDRQIVILALARLPHTSAIPVLSRELLSRNRGTRKASAFALAQIDAPESGAALEAAASQLSWWRGQPVRRALRRRRRQTARHN